MRRYGSGSDFFERMLRERPGNLVIISGRNRPKIERIVASVKAGLNVLAGKPWIIRSADLPKVQRALDEAQAKDLVAYDIMTERYEIAELEVKGVRYPVRWACRQKTNPDGSLTLARNVRG